MRWRRCGSQLAPIQAEDQPIPINSFAADPTGNAAASEIVGDGASQSDDRTLRPIDRGDNAWMLTSSALVLLMTAPGLAMFYGGLVRKKNVLGVMMQCVFLMGLMSVIWAVYGYSFAFGGHRLAATRRSGATGSAMPIICFWTASARSGARAKPSFPRIRCQTSPG